MARSIPIGPDGNLNPKIGICMCCRRESGSLMLLGANAKKLKYEDGSSAEDCINMLDTNLCKDCEETLENGGVWLVKADDGKFPVNPEGIRLRAHLAEEFLGDEHYGTARESGGIVLVYPKDFEQIVSFFQQLQQQQSEQA